MCPDGGRQQARQGIKNQTGGHPGLILAQGNSTRYFEYLFAFYHPEKPIKRINFTL